MEKSFLSTRVCKICFRIANKTSAPPLLLSPFSFVHCISNKHVPRMSSHDERTVRGEMLPPPKHTLAVPTQQCQAKFGWQLVSPSSTFVLLVVDADDHYGFQSLRWTA